MRPLLFILLLCLIASTAANIFECKHGDCKKTDKREIQSFCRVNEDCRPDECCRQEQCEIFCELGSPGW